MDALRKAEEAKKKAELGGKSTPERAEDTSIDELPEAESVAETTASEVAEVVPSSPLERMVTEPSKTSFDIEIDFAVPRDEPTLVDDVAAHVPGYEAGETEAETEAELEAEKEDTKTPISESTRNEPAASIPAPTSSPALMPGPASIATPASPSAPTAIEYDEPDSSEPDYTSEGIAFKVEPASEPVGSNADKAEQENDPFAIEYSPTPVKKKTSPSGKVTVKESTAPTPVPAPAPVRPKAATPVKDKTVDTSLEEVDRRSARNVFAAKRKTSVLNSKIMLAGIGVLIYASLGADSSLRHDGSLTSFQAPLMKSIVPLIFLLFWVPGAVYGFTAGTFKSSKDMIDAMNSGKQELGCYDVLCFSVVI